MENEFSRTSMLLGQEAMERLLFAHVAVFGIGGVGGYAAEALARSGVGTITLVDKDTVSITNINRQIIATHDTIGKAKAAVMKERILTINPQAMVFDLEMFYNAETMETINLSEFSYIIDAIDTVSCKLLLIEQAKRMGVPIISSMGAGNKLDPSRFEVADIFSTSVCPLAKVMRRELRKRGIDSLKVVYSREEPIKREKVTQAGQADSSRKKDVPGSIAFVPSVAGLILAGEAIKELAGDLKQK